MSITATKNIQKKNKIEDESNFSLEDLDLGISSCNKDYLLRGMIYTSIPSDLIAEYSNTSNKNKHCQKSVKIFKSTDNISGEEFSTNIIISGTDGILNKKSNSSSKNTSKSDSLKESKSPENNSPTNSPFNFDTPSFTEHLNTYDFVTEERENFHDNASFCSRDRHGNESNELNRAFIRDLRSVSRESTDHDIAVFKMDNCNRKNHKDKRDDSEPRIRIRANKHKESKTIFNQEIKNHKNNLKVEQEWMEQFRSMTYKPNFVN
jgi:hypothetical protein